MTEPIKPIDLYANGKCECRTEMKGKHIWFNLHLDSSKHFTAYICQRCNKPVYDSLLPPVR
jgi:hypothetical protein